ncbi:hypothetical protein [Winogradskyella schleiferi]|uniref:hypothetical protein n=1 Tax=Winogradskyella schleiferi TaxID=2686078 RepID=UPI0015B97309|nr:hypothetical protein [Winogradskyella schleiferi]
MKRLFKNILILAVMLGTYTSFANAKLEVLPTFKNVKKGNSISVTNAAGAIIFRGSINFDGNIKNLYDFSQLKDGIYRIEIDKDFEIEVSTVEVKNNSVNFIIHKSETVFKPVFRVEDSRVIISKLALTDPEMQIELYFENELIYSETVNGSEVINRVFRLDEDIKGDYTAIVKSDGRVFIKNFYL